MIYKFILGGLVALKYGSKKTILFGMFVGSIGTLLVPVCAHIFYLFICLRFLTGLAQVKIKNRHGLNI
jgi:MFS family permease